MHYTDTTFLEFAEQLYSFEQLDVALNKIAARITQDFGDEKPLVVGVMNGALITLGHLLPKINLAVDIDYCHATRYGNKTSGGELSWRVYPQRECRGRSVLLVDDIFDEGITLKLIAEYYLAHGAKSVKTAVLLNKDHARKVSSFTIDYASLNVADRYVFGFGLDYKNDYRNAPGIYALTES